MDNNLLAAFQIDTLPWTVLTDYLLPGTHQIGQLHHHYHPLVLQGDDKNMDKNSPAKLFTGFLNFINPLCFFGLFGSCIKDSESLVDYLVGWGRFIYTSALTVVYMLFYSDMLFSNFFFIIPLNLFGLIWFKPSILLGTFLLFPIEAIKFSGDPDTWWETFK